MANGGKRAGSRRARRWAAALALLALGCGSESDNENEEPKDTRVVPESVTWSQHIAPLVAEKCNGCHQAGGIAPLSFESYELAYEWAGRMLLNVEAGTMPPWGAQKTDECSPRHSWKDDPRLDEYETDMLRAWVEAGAPEGDPALAAPLPAAASLTLDDANLHLTLPSAIEVSGNTDRFVCFSLDPGLANDTWIDGVQVNPGNEAIVHHVLIFADLEAESVTKAGADGYYDCFGGPGIQGDLQLLGAWAPGALPALTPPGVALPLKGGARLVMQVHYHPTGAGVDVDDGTSVDLRFAQGEPEYVGGLALLGNFERANMDEAGGLGFGLVAGPGDPEAGPEFLIPANAKAHTETLRLRIPDDSPTYHVWGAGTHMHYVGRDMKIEVQRAGTLDECLVQTPAWDFNWQRLYYYDTPIERTPTVNAGDVISMRCTYDNSMDNVFVREALAARGETAPLDVRLGEETLDEMCLGVFGIAAKR
jgi:hypothetical protein